MYLHSRQGTEDRPKKRLLASPTSLRAMLQMCLELGPQLILRETVTGIFKRREVFRSLGNPILFLLLSVAFQKSGEPFCPNMCTWCDGLPCHRPEVMGPVIKKVLATSARSSLILCACVCAPQMFTGETILQKSFVLETQVTSLKMQPFSPSVLFSHLLGLGWYTETPHSEYQPTSRYMVFLLGCPLSFPTNRKHIKSACVCGDTSQHTFDKCACASEHRVRLRPLNPCCHSGRDNALLYCWACEYMGIGYPKEQACQGFHPGTSLYILMKWGWGTLWGSSVEPF